MVLWSLRPLAPSPLPPKVLSCIPGSRSWGSAPFPASLKGLASQISNCSKSMGSSLSWFLKLARALADPPHGHRGCPSGGHPTGAPLQPAQRPLRPERVDWDLPGQVEPQRKEGGGRDPQRVGRGAGLARAGRAEGRARVRFRGRHREVPLKASAGFSPRRGARLRSPAPCSPPPRSQASAGARIEGTEPPEGSAVERPSNRLPRCLGRRRVRTTRPRALPDLLQVRGDGHPAKTLLLGLLGGGGVGWARARSGSVLQSPLGASS